MAVVDARDVPVAVFIGDRAETQAEKHAEIEQNVVQSFAEWRAELTTVFAGPLVLWWHMMVALAQQWRDEAGCGVARRDGGSAAQPRT